MLLKESKNKYESFIYSIWNRLVDDEEEIQKVTTDRQQEELQRSAEDAEEWMFDKGCTANLAMYEARYAALSTPAPNAFSRMTELEARTRAVEALNKELGKITDLMTACEKTMVHIKEEERKEVLNKVGAVAMWVAKKV